MPVWSEDGKLKVHGYLGPFYKTQTRVKGTRTRESDHQLPVTPGEGPPSHGDPRHVHVNGRAHAAEQAAGRYACYRSATTPGPTRPN